MNLIERLVRESKGHLDDIKYLREELAEAKARLDIAETKLRDMHDIVERTKGGWNGITKLVTIISAIVGGAAAVLNWLKGGR